MLPSDFACPMVHALQLDDTTQIRVSVKPVEESIPQYTVIKMGSSRILVADGGFWLIFVNWWDEQS